MNKFAPTSPTASTCTAQTGTPPAAPASGQQKMPPRRTWLRFLLILVVNYLLMHSFFPQAGAPEKIPYTLFKQEVANSNVEAIYSRDDTIRGRFPKSPSRGVNIGTPCQFPSTLCSAKIYLA